MNKLRYQYHQETGIRIQDYDFGYKSEEYIEWLEEKIEDATKQAAQINDLVDIIRVFK